MRKLLPFGLLIPVFLLVGFFVASQFGYALPYGSQTGALIGAAAWALLFLIVHGHMRGWRSVRLFLVLFVVGKFSAIFFRQMVHEVALSRVFVELGGAAVVA